MTDLINNIVKECCIPDDLRKSILVPVYKGKGDPLTGFTQVREKSGKILFPQGQGKVSEFLNWSVNFEFDIKSGNFDL